MLMLPAVVVNRDPPSPSPSICMKKNHLAPVTVTQTPRTRHCHVPHGTEIYELTVINGPRILQNSESFVLQSSAVLTKYIPLLSLPLSPPRQISGHLTHKTSNVKQDYSTFSTPTVHTK